MLYYAPAAPGVDKAGPDFANFGWALPWACHVKCERVSFTDRDGKKRLA